jgi:hypothetical protein
LDSASAANSVRQGSVAAAAFQSRIVPDAV